MSRANHIEQRVGDAADAVGLAALLISQRIQFAVSYDGDFVVIASPPQRVTTPKEKRT